MPTITDARRQLPAARFVWLVEEAFAPLAHLHPAVDEVIPIAARRWRNALFARSTWHEITELVRLLRARSFDVIIDTQGLVRTATIARLARGQRHGYDWHSVREPPAALAYDRRHSVARSLHAIERNRALGGLALGYQPSGPVDYGLALSEPVRPINRPAYAVFLHATARAEKQWSQAQWRDLGREIATRNYDIVVPWGTPAERERSEQIAAGLPNACVPDRRPPDEMARLIAGAAVVVGVDTGLVHLAAALERPLVAIFLTTTPELTGPQGRGPIAIVGGKDKQVETADVLRAIDEVI